MFREIAEKTVLMSGGNSISSTREKRRLVRQKDSKIRDWCAKICSEKISFGDVNDEDIFSISDDIELFAHERDPDHVLPMKEAYEKGIKHSFTRKAELKRGHLRDRARKQRMRNEFPTLCFEGIFRLQEVRDFFRFRCIVAEVEFLLTMMRAQNFMVEENKIGLVYEEKTGITVHVLDDLYFDNNNGLFRTNIKSLMKDKYVSTQKLHILEQMLWKRFGSLDNHDRNEIYYLDEK